MKAQSAPMSVADYCSDFNSGKIRVNEDYQRNDGLWTAQARSFFIESILLEYPIPKLFMHAKLDLKSRQTIKEVVDGQQRTHALVSFFNNKQRLTKNIDTEELRLKKYNQLEPEWQSRFLSYSLPIDQFTGASEIEVREAFRRMNANNVPLNDEEQRNARFQGPFKWFVVRVADQFKEALSQIGVFSRRDLIRMNDLKVYAEIVLAIDSGFSTVKGTQIDALYRKYNSSFEREDQYLALLQQSVERFIDDKELHLESFLRGHVFQSLVLAMISLSANVDEVRQLSNDVDRVAAEQVADVRAKAVSLETLNAALIEPALHSSVQDFIDACSKKTNVEASKRTRYIYFREALKRRAA